MIFNFTYLCIVTCCYLCIVIVYCCYLFMICYYDLLLVMIYGVIPLFFFAFFNYYLNTFRRILLPYETVFYPFSPLL